MAESNSLFSSPKQARRLGIMGILAVVFVAGGIYMNGGLGLGLMSGGSSSPGPADVSTEDVKTASAEKDESGAQKAESGSDTTGEADESSSETSGDETADELRRQMQDAGDEEQSSTSSEQETAGPSPQQSRSTGTDTESSSPSPATNSNQDTDKRTARTDSESASQQSAPPEPDESSSDEEPLAYNPFTGDAHEVMSVRHQVRLKELELKRKQKQAQIKELQEKMDSVGESEDENRPEPQQTQQRFQQQNQQQNQQTPSEQEKRQADREQFNNRQVTAISPMQTRRGMQALILVGENQMWVEPGDRVFSLKVVDVTQNTVTIEARHGMQQSYPYTYDQSSSQQGN